MVSSPINREELFNLRHASARNVIERIFGSLKKRFRIIRSSPPSYSFDIQARIPSALSAIHNYIFHRDPLELEDIENGPDPTPGNLPADHVFGTLVHGAPSTAEKERAKTRRDAIAEAMWVDYQALLLERTEAGLLE